MFTQDFFTENATHKQNCTSFNPKSVITYNVNYGKPFLNMSRSDAQISIRLPLFLHTYATEYAPIYHCALPCQFRQILKLAYFLT
ncbi:hypothetical protein BHF20_04430 [Escherichia coli]|nr:hypothetical protein EC767_11250 [Escherichia coli]EFN9268055.1 hypothetical protein [Escherichia coli]EFO2393595.1 hypothetical protein [Escherichia coli]EFO3323008.1 hypothetical protein [Escherichia coli]EGD6076632.1 hypothetical protein [Escherichia coli]